MLTLDTNVSHEAFYENVLDKILENKTHYMFSREAAYTLIQIMMLNTPH